VSELRRFQNARFNDLKKKSLMDFTHIYIPDSYQGILSRKDLSFQSVDAASGIVGRYAKWQSY